jgi:hypothetical protein
MFSRFIYANNEIVLDSQTVRQFEIGYIQESTGFSYEVFIIGSGILITISISDIAIPEVVAQNSPFVFFDPLKTGDSFEKKVCNVCHRLLDTHFFQKNQNAKDNRSVRRPSCNDCRETIDGVPLSVKEKEQWSLKKPHLVPFVCPICKKRTIPGLTSKVVLDHDHRSGKGRGWICDSCNTGLGRFKDDTALLHEAIRFLEKD